MHLCIFEDEYSSNYLPLTYFRPVFDLRCGALTFRERIQSVLQPRVVSIHARRYLRPLLAAENPHVEVNRISSDSCLFILGRCKIDEACARVFKKTRTDCLFMANGEPVAARLSGSALEKAREMLNGDAFALAAFDEPTIDTRATVLRYPWDLIHRNEGVLVSDLEHILGRRTRKQTAGVHKAAVLVNRRNIGIGAKSEIGAGVVLDAREGPILIGNNVKVYPAATILGPCYIGDGAQIKIGAKIYGGTSIGPLSKVGGEVEHSIIHSHANKQHDGFLGHSYLGQWVNLGAGTTASNLKNTYGTIKVHMNGRLVDSGQMFLGLLAGDHAKTGINATLDTGTVIGVSSNVYGTAIPPKLISSFSWGDSLHRETYDPKKALMVAEKVMLRRGVHMMQEYRDVFQAVFVMTEHERSGHRH
jgi:UDP-N-acetylglucosamine diphosphorylase/glucosamine-1-phosphate N-acetyltransferase